MIDPRRLRVLQAFALHGSITTAGTALHMSPSAVSQQLAALEREVGHELFERQGRRIRLTATGEVMARHASRLSTVLEEAEADLAAAALGQVGNVTIAAFTSAITEVVAPAIVALRALSPHVQVHVKDAEGPTGQRLLAQGEVDIAVDVAHQEATFSGIDDFRREPLYVEPFDALVPSHHDLADTRQVELAQLATDAWITPWPGNPIRELTFFACEEAGFRPTVDSVSNDFRAVCALVAAGAGVALAPRSALRGMHLDGVSVLPIRTRPPTRNVNASVRHGAERHPLVNQVLSAMREQAKVLDADAAGPII